MRQKKGVNKELQNRYLMKAKKKEKIMILDKFTRLTGNNPSYLTRVLRKKKILD